MINGKMDRIGISEVNISKAVIYIFLFSSLFSVTGHQSGKCGQSCQISSHVSLEIGGPGSATYLPLVVQHHTAWSTHKGLSTF